MKQVDVSQPRAGALMAEPNLYSAPKQDADMKDTEGEAFILSVHARSISLLKLTFCNEQFHMHLLIN